MNIKKIFLLLFLNAVFVGIAYSQSHEAGIRFSSLSNFDFIYKKQSAAGNFHRFRIAAVNASALSRSTGTDFNLGLGLAYGYEKRLALGDKTYFLHGFEPSVFADFRPNGQNVNFQLGYVLGLQYNFHRQFYVNLELLPSLGVMGNFLDGNDPVYIAGFNVDSRFVSLSLVHQF